MEITLEMVLDTIGMTADDARIDEETGEVYVPLSKTLALWLKDDKDDCDCACACDCEDSCDCEDACDCEDTCDCDCEDDECEDDCGVPNLVELAQTYGVEILVNERNRAKELGQQEAFDALNFAVDVLLHQNALDTEWLADTYDNVMG